MPLRKLPTSKNHVAANSLALSTRENIQRDLQLMATKSLKADSLFKGKADPETAEDLASLLIAIRDPKHVWDAIAFTDGSGTISGAPGGFAAVIIYRRLAKPVFIEGSLGDCTSQAAEVRAVYELMNHLVESGAGNKTGGFNLYLVTDSGYVASRMQKLNVDPVAAVSSKKHVMSWVGIQHAARVGIHTTTTHLHRNKNPLMRLVDHASRNMRLAYPLVELQTVKDKELAFCDKQFPLTKPDRRKAGKINR